MIDEELYQRATDELNSDARRPHLWARACALANDDHDEARYLYTNLRVEELSAERKASEERAPDDPLAADDVPSELSLTPLESLDEPDEFASSDPGFHAADRSGFDGSGVLQDDAFEPSGNAEASRSRTVLADNRLELDAATEFGFDLEDDTLSPSGADAVPAAEDPHDSTLDQTLDDSLDRALDGTAEESLENESLSQPEPLATTLSELANDEMGGKPRRAGEGIEQEEEPHWLDDDTFFQSVSEAPATRAHDSLDDPLSFGGALQEPLDESLGEPLEEPRDEPLGESLDEPVFRSLDEPPHERRRESTAQLSAVASAAGSAAVSSIRSRAAAGSEAAIDAPLHLGSGTDAAPAGEIRNPMADARDLDELLATRRAPFIDEAEDEPVVELDGDGPVWALYESDTGRINRVRRGVSWGALLFTLPWLLWRGLLGTALVYALLWIVTLGGLALTAIAWSEAGADAPVLLRVLCSGFALIALLGLIVLPFLRANRWRETAWQRRGDRLRGEVRSKSGVAAVRRVTASETAERAAVRPSGTVAA